MRLSVGARLALVLCIALGFALPGIGSACTQSCVMVGPSCWRCQEMGVETNSLCHNEGSCLCMYDFCFAKASDPGQAQTRTTLAELGLSPVPAACAAAPEVVPPLAAD